MEEPEGVLLGCTEHSPPCSNGLKTLELLSQTTASSFVCIERGLSSGIIKCEKWLELSTKTIHVK